MLISSALRRSPLFPRVPAIVTTKGVPHTKPTVNTRAKSNLCFTLVPLSSSFQSSSLHPSFFSLSSFHTFSSPSFFLSQPLISSRFYATHHNLDQPSSPDIPVPFLLADIGEGITEVEILQWFVKPGDHIKQFDPLVEVQSDKATVEITSRFQGVVHSLNYQVGDVAKVGTPLCFFQNQVVASLASSASSGSVSATETPATAPTTTMAVPASTPLSPSSFAASSTDSMSFKNKILTTPAVRKIAKDQNVDLTKVPATGSYGNILKEDLIRFIQNNSTSTPPSHPATDAKISSDQLLPASSLSDYKTSAGQEANWTKRDVQRDWTQALQTRTEPIRGLRRAMVKSMTLSLQIPQLGLGEEVVFDNLQKLRMDLAPSVENLPFRITYMPFLIKALSLALTSFPIVNSSVDHECQHIIYHPHHHISIAMDTPAGLIVPNIKNVQNLSVLDIAEELARLSSQAKSGKFPEEDLAGGTFALSNIGSIGGTYTSPVVMPPQVAIGALGRLRMLPRYDENGVLKPMKIMHVNWAADHRIIDGATIANFSNAWKRLIEHPSNMLLYMK